MELVIEKIKDKKPEWNQQQLTETDFYDFCFTHDILVIETPLRYRIKAMLWFVENQYVVTINSRTQGASRLFAMWHEIGHFIMHYPSKKIATYFWGDEVIYGGNRREENEADFFALCAVIPTIWVETKTFQELLDEECIPEEIIYKRKKIYERYKV